MCRAVFKSSAAGTATSHDTILLQLFFGDLKFYTGLTLAGSVGQCFRVEYAEVLNQHTTHWLVLTPLPSPLASI